MIKLTISVLRFIGLFVVCFLVLYLISAAVGSFIMWENKLNASLWGVGSRYSLVCISFVSAGFLYCK